MNRLNVVRCRQPYKCEWEECGELFGRRSMLLAHVRARHDGTVRMRVVQSPGGTNQVAEVVGWNGYRTCVAVTPRKSRGRMKEETVHGVEDDEVKREWGADSMYHTAVGSEEGVEEEKTRMDGDLLPSTDDGLLYWPDSDMQGEYKELGDSSQPLFSTFPSLPSPHSSPLLCATSSFVTCDQSNGVGYFAASPSVPVSVWSSPPPVPHWQPPRFNTASLHTTSAVPSPLFASPLHSPRLWHDQADSDM